MPFQKGHGRLRDAQSYKAAGAKISVSKMGVKRGSLTKEWRLRISIANRGNPKCAFWKGKSKPHSEETKLKIGLANTGRKPSRLAIERSALTRRRKALTREPSKDNNLERASLRYQQWRRAVLRRDGRACTVCGINKVPLHADHIKRWSDYPELRFVVDNGRTLCVPCHRKTKTWGGRKAP